MKKYMQVGGAMIETKDGQGKPMGDWVKASDYDDATAWQRVPLAILAQDHPELAQYLRRIEYLVTRLEYAATAVGA